MEMSELTETEPTYSEAAWERLGRKVQPGTEPYAFRTRKVWGQQTETYPVYRVSQLVPLD